MKLLLCENVSLNKTYTGNLLNDLTLIVLEKVKDFKWMSLFSSQKMNQVTLPGNHFLCLGTHTHSVQRFN